MRVFDSGDLRVTMKEGSTWTFNPECCTLLSEEAAAAAAAANGDAATNDEGESSSDDEDEDSIQITRMLSTLTVHNRPKTLTVLTRNISVTFRQLLLCFSNCCLFTRCRHS